MYTVSQTYDAASVMNGKNNGIQALFRQKLPEAIYIMYVLVCTPLQS